MSQLDKAKAKRDRVSPFGQWMEEAAVSKGTSLQEIAGYIGQEYTFVSRLYDGTKSPTYEIAEQIGEMVEDAAGALAAAGFAPAESASSQAAPLPKRVVKTTSTAATPTRRLLASGDELTVSADDSDPDETARKVEAFLQALRKEQGAGR